MSRRDPRALHLVILTLVVLVLLGGFLMAEVGRPYPGFFVAPDYRIFPADASVEAAGLAWGDRIVDVDGASALTLAARVRADRGPVRYAIERDGRRLTAELLPRPFSWPLLLAHFGVFFAVSAVMLAVGIAVYSQNPSARPNRCFLLYMCLWAVSNVAVPASVLGSVGIAAAVVGFVSIVLSVHGWIFFLTYPSNPSREACLERHRVMPRLYRAAVALGLLSAATFLTLSALKPELLVDGWVYPASGVTLFTLAAISFPIKIIALLDTRRRAASPLVNQQTTAAQAQSGEILLSEATCARLGADLQIEDMGLRELKGVERPVRLFRLPGAGM